MDKKEAEIKEMIKDFVRRISPVIAIDNVIFFGSRSRGEAKKNSDIDLLVISKDFEGVKFFKRSPALYMVWDYPYDIDIICLTPKEFEKKKKQIGVISEAVKEGIKIK